MKTLSPSPMTAPYAGESTRLRPIALHRDVLLATDGSPAAFAATRCVNLLATRFPLTLHALTVVAPPMPFDPMGANAVIAAGIEREVSAEVRRQLTAAANGSIVWQHQVAVGTPGPEIVRVASQRGSELIVLGLRRHALLDRVFRDETALSVMRHAAVPVLGIASGVSRAPRRIAVAIDFSRASIAAARAALTLLDDTGALMLVYVEPSTEPLREEAEGFAAIYAQGVAGAFTRLRQELAMRTKASIETVVLQGGVVPELVSFADRADIDVLAMGSQRHSIARRAFVGGVTTALARTASCSLLVLPPNGR